MLPSNPLQLSSSRRPASPFVGETFFFKVGDYDQTAVNGTPGTQPGTVVKVYALQVVHQWCAWLSHRQPRLHDVHRERRDDARVAEDVQLRREELRVAIEVEHLLGHEDEVPR